MELREREAVEHPICDRGVIIATIRMAEAHLPYAHSQSSNTTRHIYGERERERDKSLKLNICFKHYHHQKMTEKSH